MTPSLRFLLLAVALLGAVGCGEQQVKSALEREADRNMPPKAELTEPLYWPDDKVRKQGASEVLTVRDVVWVRSRKYPNGGYVAHPVDGWWYRCREPELPFERIDGDIVYVPEGKLELVESGIPLESREPSTAVEAKGGE